MEKVPQLKSSNKNAMTHIIVLLNKLNKAGKQVDKAF
jgi:hypothetical protein